MKSLLDALQGGRLVELPTNNKQEVLEYLALLLEAVPGIQTDVDIVKEIQNRESTGNTGIGKGIACPHVRTKTDTEMLCAVGWSPEGIDYDSLDGKKVHIVIMYYIPDSQRVAYLKELSGLAKAVSKTSGEVLFENIGDINTVRNRLLDWVEMSVSDAVPDSTARMIRIEAKQAAVESVRPDETKKPVTIIPFTLIGFDGGDYKILAQDKEFMEQFEKEKSVFKLIAAPDAIETEGYCITVLSSSYYASNRVVRECVAVKR